MRQPSVRAKASTVETAALPRSLRRCSYIWMERRVTPERRASPDWLSPARTRIVCSRESPSVRLWAARSSYTSTNRLSSASCRVGCSRTISSSDSTSRMSENRTPLAHWQYASTHPAQYSGVEPACSAAGGISRMRAQPVCRMISATSSSPDMPHTYVGVPRPKSAAASEVAKKSMNRPTGNPQSFSA